MSHHSGGSARHLGWSLLGLALGFVGGVLTRDRLGTTVSRSPEGAPATTDSRPRRATAGTTRRMVQEALARDEAWQGLELEVSGVAPGVIELRGWVGDRLTRARLIRFVRALPGVDRLIDSLMVRGEDDRPGPSTDQTHQTA